MTEQGMKVLIILTALSLTATVVASPDAPHLGIEISEPAVKVIEGPDDDNDLTISISARVKNPTEREVDVKVIVQGLGRDGTELYDMYLSDAVKPGQARVFTDTDYIKQDLYKLIVTWRVEEATVRGGQPNNALQRSHSRVKPPAEETQASRHAARR